MGCKVLNGGRTGKEEWYGFALPGVDFSFVDLVWSLMQPY